MNCKKCGNELREGAKFCGKRGAKILRFGSGKIFKAARLVIGCVVCAGFFGEASFAASGIAGASGGKESPAASKSAGKVDSQNLVKTAHAYFDSGDAEKAVELFRQAAEQGNADAQNMLGRIYRSGWGVPQDYNEAVKWYRLAAEQGHAAAQFNLGWCYFEGKGVPQDYKEAVKWYILSAKQGDAWAQSDLGLCYIAGLGVPQNYSEAVKWYRLAAAQGNAEAQYVLGICYYEGNGVEKNPQEAKKWFSKAAEQGHGGAKKRLSGMR